ncbi:carboxypeptidase regulatory-like domain-containing protein [bacterium]|nr:carboxypeptidase regulatory-like domain-containing protein [bacterium]
MKKLSIFLLVFSMILSSVTPAHSWPWSRSRRLPKTATIQGQVVDFITNQAVSGAAVRAGRYRASTNASGKYVIKNIMVWFWGRVYRVKASVKGYYTSSRWIYVRRGRTYTLNFRLRPRKPLILVKITSLKDNSYIRGTSLDVSVSWQGRVGIIDLYLDNDLAASYRTWRRWHRSGNHAFKIDLSAQQDGEHKLKAIAYRSHRRRGYKAESKEITFILDNTLPVISGMSPANDALINNNQPEISAVLSDVTSGIDKDTIILKFDDAEVIPAYDEATGKLSYTSIIVLEDGTHTISIAAQDKAGNEASAASTFRVETDTTPPDITDLSPKDASIIYYTTPTISAKYSDDKSGIDKTTVKILVNAVDVTASSTITDEGVSYAPEAELTEGGITVSVEVKDNAGNLATEEFSFEIKILTVEDLLQAVANNYALLQDYQANTTITAMLNNESFGGVLYCKEYFKQPNKTKILTYKNEDRIELSDEEDIMIMLGQTYYSIDPITKEYQTLNITEQLGIDISQFNQMNLAYYVEDFKNNHNLTMQMLDGIKGIGEVTAIPKVPNNIYNKMVLDIDYEKGLVLKTEFLKDDVKQLSIEMTDYSQFDDIWFPVKMRKRPKITTGDDFYSTIEYSDVLINQGIGDDIFDPEMQ